MWKLEINPSGHYFIVNYLFVSFIFFSIPKKNIIVYHFYLILLIGVYLPITVIANHTAENLEACFVYFLSILFSLYFYYIINALFYKEITINITGYRILTVDGILKFNNFFTLIILFYLIYSNRQGLSSFNIIQTFINVYSIREENQLTGIDAYLPGWIISICIPLLIASYFKNRSYTSLFIAVIGIFFMFQIFAMKVQLFSILLLLFFGYIFTKKSIIKIFSVELFYGLTFLLTMILGNFMYAFLDRFFYLPGQLNLHYFEFFLNHPKNHFQGSKLGFFFENSPYNKPMGYIIDDYFYGGGMNANTGYLASSFGDLGYLGLLFASIIVALLSYFFSILSRKSRILAYILSIQFSFILINTPLTDIFISNGIIFLLPIILVLKPENKLQKQYE